MAAQVSNKAELLHRLSENGKLIRSFGIDRISLFGSFARDTRIKKNSDIEPGKKSFDNLVDLGFFLEELLGRKVELLTRESLKSDTGKQILASAEDIAI
jgi:predicted nucleotidyltransferase